MAAVETGQPRSHGKQKKKKRRVGVRIDMTPMVDVVLLLLTFFMLTTAFMKPQAMEINLPPNKQQTVDVAESKLLILRVSSDFKIYWSVGSDTKLQKVDFKDLRSFLADRNKSTPGLIALLRIDRDATFKNMVDIMDTFVNTAKLERFSIAPMTDADKKLMAKAG
ncbi:MAG TPA: biopolymer transporter ExbD [Bacteroidota bacterium]|nr:biopolymer transporter ExbD [Bacteroidota bacterium]